MADRKLVLDIDINKMQWKKYKLFLSLSKRMTELSESKDETLLVTVLEEFLLNFSDWTQDDIDQLTVGELLEVFNSLKGQEKETSPLESTPN